MAIIKIAPKSSITAKAVRKIFIDSGTRFPNKDKIPIAKAISVAIGIPKPECVELFGLKTRYIKAGSNMPPKAPEIGSIASFNLDSSPI